MVEFVRAEGVPIYIQIRESLRADIMQGTLKRGEQLPSENDLALKYKVSRMTIRESIEDLVDEGLLYRRHGVGTFVAYPHLQRDHTRLTNFFDKAENEGLAVQAKLLKLEVIPAKPRVAEALDIPVGSHVIRVKTLRFVNDAPVTVHDASHKIVPGLRGEQVMHSNGPTITCGHSMPRKQRTALDMRDNSAG